jgi:LPS-assembly lipoprotein
MNNGARRSHDGWRAAGPQKFCPDARSAAPGRSMAVSALTLAMVLAVLLSGCGFRLQGSMPLPAPLKVTYVIAPNDQTDFVQGLRKALLTNGGKLAEDSTNATGTVRILTDDVTSKILSVSANNIPREYELTYTVEFSVSSKDTELLPAQKVSITRDYSFDERTLLAKENEAALLREGMARDLVSIVMRRLSSL